MIRTCSVCGSVKSGAEAEYNTKSAEAHDKFWTSMHKPGCTYKPLTTEQRLDYLMASGSPLSSVQDGD